MICTREELERYAADGKPLWLFLDYDGTLADFAPSPDHVIPDPNLIQLIRDLAETPSIRVSIISGRRLGHIEKLAPVPGVILAGTYGMELLLSDSQHLYRVAYEEIRPTLDRIKPAWQTLIANRDGFYLEDKGWALALHANLAADELAAKILDSAKSIAETNLEPKSFQVLGGHKFLEVGSKLSDKGKTVRYLIEEFPFAGAAYVFIGDDDKDEQAFKVIKDYGGCAIRVSLIERPTLADWRLPDPVSLRKWLSALVKK